jgi:hypothetical protein
MLGCIARMRFKRETMAFVRQIFATYGDSATANFLHLAFRGKLRRFLADEARSEMEPEEAAGASLRR